MIYHSVGDIYAANDEVRRRLVARVAELQETQASRRPDERAWSPAEIVEHLSIVEGNMVRLVAKMLDKIESEAAHAPAAPPAMPPFSLADYEEQIREQKLTAPETINPRGLPLNESVKRLAASRAAINEFRPRVETADGTRARYPHPFFGPLNLYQWLAFIGLHESRHLRQLEGALEMIKAE